MKLEGNTLLEMLKELDCDERLDELLDSFSDKRKVGIVRLVDKDTETALEIQVVLEHDESKFDDATPIIYDIGKLEREVKEDDSVG